MGRRLIFRCQLPRRGHLSRQSPEASPTYAVLAILSDCCPPPEGRLPTCYAPVRHFTSRPKPTFSFDLHVLGPPLTFALSQDQTLQLNLQRRPKPAPLTTIEHQYLLGNHYCWGIEGRSLRLPFELDLLFSFQRPTRDSLGR